MAFDNLTQVIVAHGENQPEHPCLRFHRDGRWQDLGWGELLRQVTSIAGGLAVTGVAPGERVAIISANRPEWALADLGSIAAGAVVVTVYPTLPADEAAFILGHSSSRLAFVENRAQLDKLRPVLPRLGKLRHLVLLEGEPEGEPGAISLASLQKLATAEQAKATVARAASAARETPLTVVYTSGTTGTPKGAVLTHGNILGTLEAVIQAFGDTSHLRLNLSFLPLAHALERIAGHFLPLLLGRTIAYARSLDTLIEDFPAVRPSFAVAVPRVFEKVHARILGQVQARPPLARRVFTWAIEVGTRRSTLQERGEAIPAPLRVQQLLADLLVTGKIRARLGGRINLFVSGGAPLAAEVARFFHAAGILICEGWGATETSAPATWNTPTAFRLGSVGRALPGIEVKIAADGELLVRGVNVFAGYLDNAADTAECFDEDGFYRTGDIGRRDQDGFFYITDRKKELVILASGKNIAPQKIENLLKQQPLISSAMVHGDRRPYLVALVTVDRAALAARRPELADAGRGDDRLHGALASNVAAVNQQLARFEQIKRFAIVEPDFSPEGGELTLTLKLKRRVVAAVHGEALEALYR